MKLSNNYLKTTNKQFKKTVFTTHFTRQLDSAVRIEGLTPSSYSFRQEYIFDRQTVTEENEIRLKPEDFLQYFSAQVNPDGLGFDLQDEVLDLRVEYVRDRETFRAWLGYMSPRNATFMMVPRPGFRKDHESFRVIVNRVNVVDNSIKSHFVDYESVPGEMIVDDAWFALAREQATARLKAKMKQKSKADQTKKNQKPKQESKKEG